ncbi:unnamed protein product [Agarophyton chilense]
MSAKQNPVRLFIREYLAVVLWTCSVLWLFFLSDTEFLRSINPSLKRFPPSQLFLSGLVCVMGVWEIFGLSFGSPVNPAVTLSLFLAGKLSIDDAIVMAVAQFLGHLFGTLLVRRGAEMMFEREAHARFAPPQPHEGLSYKGAVAIEMGITFLMCVLALSLDSIFGKRAIIKKWSVMTSITIAMVAGAGEWTGACMNPAMSLALSLLENLWKNHEIYWIGPISGALLAAGLYRWSFDDKRYIRRFRQRKMERRQKALKLAAEKQKKERREERKQRREVFRNNRERVAVESDEDASDGANPAVRSTQFEGLDGVVTASVQPFDFGKPTMLPRASKRKEPESQDEGQQTAESVLVDSPQAMSPPKVGVAKPIKKPWKRKISYTHMLTKGNLRKAKMKRRKDSRKNAV